MVSGILCALIPIQSFGSAFGQTDYTVTITFVTNASPFWGIEEIGMIGSVSSNFPLDSTVDIDWGDGTEIVTGLPLNGFGEWDPTFHTYGKEATQSNPNEIIVTLRGSDASILATSDPYPIEVQNYGTTLSLSSTSTLVVGEELSLSGSLVDSLNSVPLVDKEISFSGTGIDNELTVTTDQEGAFSLVTPSPGESGTAWTIQAHYAGEAGYAGADSEIMTFDTVESGTTILPVSSGTNVIVPIEGLTFSASVEFDELVSDGSLYMLECTTPDNPLYVSPSPLGICLQLSPTAQLADGSFAHITLSYDNSEALIPEENTEADLALFHEVAEGSVVDITESRDSSANTLTGKTDSFSNFVIALAEHSEKPLNAVREPLYLLDSQQLFYRDISNPNNVSSDAISLDETRYRIGDTAELTIEDEEANTDTTQRNTISAGILSTADPTGIEITLEETDNDSGIFKGSFKLTSGNSGPNKIKVGTGSELEIEYEPTHPRAAVIIDDVTQAGLIEFEDFEVETSDPNNMPPFKPIGKGMSISLVDAGTGENAKMTVSISYANAQLSGTDPSSFKIMQRQGGNNWVPISPDQGAVDLVSKIVTGETNVIEGEFTIGTCLGCDPGGAGGGGFTGRGVVVDAVASIARASGGGGTSSSSSSTGSSGNSLVAEIASGLDVQLVALVPPSSSSVGLEFQKVTSEGSIAIEEKSLSSMSQLFSEVSQSNGKIALADGQIFTTVGPLFDIQPSATVSYAGFIDITLPFTSDNLIPGSSASDVRLLHYSGDGWEDVTIKIDEKAGTVTGRVSSLSPVVAAAVNDGTFGTVYVDENPLMKILDVYPSTGLVIANGKSGITLLDADGSAISNYDVLSAGKNYQIVNSIRNIQRISQSYSYVFEVLDKNGVVVELQEVRTGVLSQGQTTKIAVNWTAPVQTGEYSFKIFVLDGSSHQVPSLLKNSISANVGVT